MVVEEISIKTRLSVFKTWLSHYRLQDFSLVTLCVSPFVKW